MSCQKTFVYGKKITDLLVGEIDPLWIRAPAYTNYRQEALVPTPAPSAPCSLKGHVGTFGVGGVARVAHPLPPLPAARKFLETEMLNAAFLAQKIGCKRFEKKGANVVPVTK